MIDTDNKQREKLAFSAGLIAGAAIAAICIMASAFVVFAIIGIMK